MPITRELFNRVLDSPIVAETCRKIADQVLVLGSPDEEIKKRAQARVSELKLSLPSFCWHAAFRNGKRKNHEAVPSGLAMLDYDHAGNPEEIFKTVRQTAISLNLVAAHVTPSCSGLRLVFSMPPNISIADFQKEIDARLKIPGFDPCVHDYARISFAVTRSYWLYIDEDALFGKKVLPNVPIQRVSRDDRPKTPPEVVAPAQNTNTKTVFDTAYKGIPYERIVFYLEHELGGRPDHGRRNITIFSIAVDIRSICNNDPDWVASVVPDYGEARDKWFATIRSACNRPLPSQLSKRLVRALEKARHSMTSNTDICKINEMADSRVNVFSTPKPPEMPIDLPPLIEHLIKNVPEVCRPAVSHAVFPAFATHLRGVMFELLDGTDKEASFICLDMAKQSVGKSSVNMPTDAICADIFERDEINRKREQEYKDVCNVNKSKNNDPNRPTNLVVQFMMTNISNAALVRKSQDADGYPLFSRINELEMLDGLKKDGPKDIGKFLCLVYDNAKYGQERVGPQSVTGIITLRWNILASTTIQKGLHYFRKNLMDGTISRLNLCTILPDKTKEFHYGKFDDEFNATLKPYITNLNLANGRIECDEALVFARKLQQRCLDICEMADDEVLGDLVYRAVDIAYLKSMVLYVAQDMKWDKQIEEFTEWSLIYDLWCKNYYFGALLAEAYARETVKQRPGQTNLLDSLPNCFDIEIVSALRSMRGMNPDARHMLATWKARGFISFNCDTEQYEKTTTYLSK